MRLAKLSHCGTSRGKGAQCLQDSCWGKKPTDICIYLEKLGNMGKNKNIYIGFLIIKSTVLCSNIEK